MRSSVTISAGGLNWVGKVENVAHSRRAEGVDRLRVVADHRQPSPLRFQPQKDRGLQPVGVLIFIDENMIEAPADVVRKLRIADHLRPVEQQVVIIEHALPLLRFDIAGKQLLQLGGPGGAPWEESRSTSSTGISALMQRE